MTENIPELVAELRSTRHGTTDADPWATLAARAADEQAVERIMEILSTALVDAAVQSPEDEIVTTVVPSWADGSVVFIEGAINLETLARALATRTSA